VDALDKAEASGAKGVAIKAHNDLLYETDLIVGNRD
jgi:hypothetical protein